MKMSNLPEMIGVRVCVEIDSDTPSNLSEIEGVLVGVSATGVAVKIRTGLQFYSFVDILDITKVNVARKIVRRRIRHIVESQTRQHLLDRHGIPWDLTKALSPSSAYAMHEKIDHSNLGHQHNSPDDPALDEEEEA